MGIKQKALHGLIGVLFASICCNGQNITQILEKTIARATQERHKNHPSKYQFKVLKVSHRLDGQGKLKKSDEKIYENILIDGFPYEKLTKKNGRSLNKKEKKEELKRQIQFRKKITKVEDPTIRDENKKFSINKDLLNRYDFVQEDVEDIEGRSNYVLSWKPKAGKLPTNRRIDHALNKSEGRIWIDQELYEVSRVEFELRETVKLWWGVIGSIQIMKGTVQRQEVDSGTWFTTKFDLYLKGRVFFKSLHRKQQIRWTKFNQSSSSKKQNIPYKRNLYGKWRDIDKDCQNTRQEVLISKSLVPVKLDSKGCRVISGKWFDPYTGQTFISPRDLDIDHFIPLAEVHRSGGNIWDRQRRQRYANDLSYKNTLIAVSSSTNRAKGDKDPARWLPPNKSFHCEYVQLWAATKKYWILTMDNMERKTIKSILQECE